MVDVGADGGNGIDECSFTDLVGYAVLTKECLGLGFGYCDDAGSWGVWLGELSLSNVLLLVPTLAGLCAACVLSWCLYGVVGFSGIDAADGFLLGSALPVHDVRCDVGRLSWDPTVCVS